MANLSAFCAVETFAANAVALKDTELDSVYAEGLSFKFDVSVARPDTVFKNSSPRYDNLGRAGVNLPGNNNAANTQNGGIGQIQFDLGLSNSKASNPTSNNPITDNTAAADNAAPQLNSSDNITEMLLAGNAGINTVLVTGSSQQYLSSLVNVNAAGSFVPVLINIVININSTIDNLSNVNSLNLADAYRYQLR